MGYYLILDIGGTKTTAAVFTEEGQPYKDYFYVVPSRTYEGADAVFENTVQAGFRTMSDLGITGDKLIGIGAAAPGPLDYKTGYIIDVPMMGWKDFPLGGRLKKKFNVPVCLDNDGNLGALAEQRVGVARGCKNVLYMTVSTGCGGGIIINGELYRGNRGSAGEFGHMTINLHGRPCGCGGSGCFELYASGTAMNERMKRDMRKGIKSLAFEKIGYDPEKVNGKILGEAAEEGDPYSLDFIREEGYYLGVGLGNLFNLYDPDVIVLGGGITKLHKWFKDEMLREINRHSCLPVENDRVRFSELNDRVVAYGACCLIKEYIEKGCSWD